MSFATGDPWFCFIYFLAESGTDHRFCVLELFFIKFGIFWDLDSLSLFRGGQVSLRSFLRGILLLRVFDG